MAPVFCPASPPLFEYHFVNWQCFKSGIATLPGLDDWHVLGQSNEDRIGKDPDAPLFPRPPRSWLGGSSCKFILARDYVVEDHPDYTVYNHKTGGYDSVVLRRIPSNGAVLSIQTERTGDRVSVKVTYALSGRECFAQSYPVKTKLRVYEFRNWVLDEMFERGMASANTTFHLVFEGQTKRLRGNTLV